jgi:spermidine/putrescine transport system ATP-binding protein
VRPELILIAAREAEQPIPLDVEAQAIVKNRIFLGEQTEYLVETEDLGEVLVRTPKHIEALSGGFRPGDRVRIGWQADSALALSDS